MLISIITPVKNGARYIEDTIDSVLSQSYPFIEHIILDGGSTDGSLDVITPLAHQYPGRIKLICGHDRGACDALNNGWREAKGDVLGWLGSDDRYFVDTIQTVADFFTTNPNIHFLYGGCDIIDNHGEYIGRFATREFDLSTALNHGLYVPFPSAFYRRRVIETTGPVSVGHKACDSDFTIRASRRYRLHRIPSSLAQFRLHEDSISCTSGLNDFPRALFQMNRAYGGRLLSPVCLRYLISLIKKVPFINALCSWMTPWHYQSRESTPFGTVAIFGASLSGYQCLNKVLANGQSVDCFIDNHPPSGDQYCSRPVLTPSVFLSTAADGVDAVLIASSSSAFAMWRQLRRMGFKKPLRIFRLWTER